VTVLDLHPLPPFAAPDVGAVVTTSILSAAAAHPPWVKGAKEMTFDPPLEHDALLTLARKTEAAAHDGDRDRLEAAALHLFEALVEHVGAEQFDLSHLAPGEGRLLSRGQQRIVGLLVELAIGAEAPGPCRCDDLAQQLLAQLSLQADDERLAGVAPRHLP
jgi:hypothetical protein